MVEYYVQCLIISVPVSFPVCGIDTTLFLMKLELELTLASCITSCTQTGIQVPNLNASLSFLFGLLRSEVSCWLELS